MYSSLFCFAKVKFGKQNLKLRDKKNVFFEELRWNESFVKTGFLTKIDDKEGHVFELLFSDELYNFARGGEKRSIVGYKSFNVLF